MPSPTQRTESEVVQRRPTLPSIHTLNLPNLPRATQSDANVSYATPINSKYPLPYVTTINSHHGRRVSTSSSCTTASRNCSPTPDSDTESTTASKHRSQMSSSLSLPPKIRLIPCSMEEANAIILMRNAPPSSSPSGSPSNNDKGSLAPLLLFGSAVDQLRQPNRQLAKSARVHPYRIVTSTNPAPAPGRSRRSSVASLIPLTNLA